MNKSPINVLQEYAVKEGYFPVYEFISASAKGTYSEFVCRLVCKKLNCDGVGYSKKEAKHNAAVQMLSLLGQKNEISLSSSSASLSPLIEDKIQNPPNTSNCINYVGFLQEYCVSHNLSTQDVSYKAIHESESHSNGPFTIEVSVGTLQERGRGLSKKAAKQEAAKKLLQSFNLDVTKLSKGIKNIGCQETFEENIRKFGTEISGRITEKSTTSIAELSKDVQSSYIKYTKIKHKEIKKNFLLKDCHTLFERTYSSRITCDMRERMQIIRDTYIGQKNLIPNELQKVGQDIERALGVKLERIAVSSWTENYIICVNLLTCPKITVLGMGETKGNAENIAMYNLIVAILIFLNIF